MLVPYIPKELINIILDYDWKIRYRNGKYITQINIENPIYDNIKFYLNHKQEITYKLENKETPQLIYIQSSSKMVICFNCFILEIYMENKEKYFLTLTRSESWFRTFCNN